MSISTSPVIDSPIHLDGTTLEGGGQLLRLSLCLSSLTRYPIHMTNIRGKRGPKSAPEKGGGMKSAHLASAQWLSQATGAHTTGMEVKSRELVFKPSTIDEADRIKNAKEMDGMNGVWKDIYIKGKLVRRESDIPMSTPGSIFLIFQAILPYILLFAPSLPLTSSSFPEPAEPSVPVRITIHGGTNVSNSPSFEYIDQVLLPMLNSKVGIPPISMKLNSRGWSQGRADVGSVTFDITPLSRGSSLPAFSFTGRGEIAKIHVSVLASGAAIRNSIREKLIERILNRHPDIEILFPVDEDSQNTKRLYLLLIAETSAGYRLGRDWLYDRNAAAPDAINRLVVRVVAELEDELKHGGCVDEFLQDQLVVFQAISRGKGIMDIGQGRAPSLHTKTVRWVGERLLGVRFDDEGSCEGVNFKVGERYSERTRIHTVEEGVEKLSIG